MDVQVPFTSSDDELVAVVAAGANPVVVVLDVVSSEDGAPLELAEKSRVTLATSSLVDLNATSIPRVSMVTNGVSAVLFDKANGNQTVYSLKDGRVLSSHDASPAAVKFQAAYFDVTSVRLYSLVGQASAAAGASAAASARCTFVTNGRNYIPQVRVACSGMVLSVCALKLKPGMPSLRSTAPADVFPLQHVWSDGRQPVL